MSQIKIVDLEVFYSVGVTAEERAKLQRLLLTVDMSFDFSSAAMNDRLNRTIDYYAVAQRLLHYGTGRSWKLLEKLAVNLADLVFTEFHPAEVTIEVKKFPVPQAAYVSVVWTRN
jgi:dihydroneopterin aldolase